MPIPKKIDATKQRLKRLETLVDASQLLNSSLDLKKILSMLVEVAMKYLNASRGTIYLLDTEKRELWAEVLKGGQNIEIRLPFGTGIAGLVGQTGRTINLRDVYKSKSFFQGIDRQSGQRTETMLCMPMRDRKSRIVGVFQIMNKRKGFFNKEDERFLAALSLPATIAIENARLHAAELEQERMQKELEVAATIQQQLLPKSLPAVSGLQFSALTRPSREVGGDLYDVIRVDDDHLALIIADVAGKGVPSALLVSSLHASLHAYVDAGMEPALLVKKLNAVINNSATSDKFITFVYCLYEISSRTLRYVNAGHNYPIVLRANGGIAELSKGGLCLGMLPDFEYEGGTLRLDQGDLLVLYTDGVTEAMNARQDLYSEARLYATLRDTMHKDVAEIHASVLAGVKAFTEGHPQVDDFTLLLMKVV